MKYTLKSPESFIPSIIIKRVPAWPNTYQAIMNFNPLYDGLVINRNNITASINTLNDSLLNSIVISQQSNWIFITQIEFYYKDIQIENVAMVNKHEKYPKQLDITMEKCQEDRGTWF